MDYLFPMKQIFLCVYLMFSVLICFSIDLVIFIFQFILKTEGFIVGVGFLRFYFWYISSLSEEFCPNTQSYSGAGCSVACECVVLLHFEESKQTVGSNGSHMPHQNNKAFIEGIIGHPISLKLALIVEVKTNLGYNIGIKYRFQHFTHVSLCLFSLKT